MSNPSDSPPAENVDQRALRRWITAGLAIPEVVSLHGDAGYLLNNMIAKYTLAADQYAISDAALETFRALGVDLEARHRRSQFYGQKGGRNPFIYEHAIPAGVLRSALLASDGQTATVTRILGSAGTVSVLLRTEDAVLRAAGLRASMPPGWQLGDDPLARYTQAGIRLSETVLKVKGAICR